MPAERHITGGAPKESRSEHAAEPLAIYGQAVIYYQVPLLNGPTTLHTLEEIMFLLDDEDLD